MAETLSDIIEECSSLIADRGMTIAFAESATAGKLAFEFSQTEHSGEILKGALVCYDACIKEDLLHVPKHLVDEYTPESPEVTREMALKLKGIMNADIIVAVTGLPTPGGSEHQGKPVGTMFYCVLAGDELFERRKIFSGTPREIINLTIEQISKTIIHILTN
jgi:nicotinamide-nucleotide amidase